MGTPPVTLLRDFWDNYSVEVLVSLGLFFHIILAVAGSYRRFKTQIGIMLIAWASYLLAAYVSALALSKLTVVNGNEYDAEIRAILAPIILVLLGNPDSITAYSVEDNRIGLRRVVSLVFTVFMVVWVLVKSWKSYLWLLVYILLFVAGMIKYGETVWALKSVFDDDSSFVTKDDVKKRPQLDVPGCTRNLKYILKAYYRFHRFKPHLVGWLLYPHFLHDPNMSIDHFDAQEVLLITDMELSFLYDVLYTKAPVLYTSRGIALRLISYCCMVVAFAGFLMLFPGQFDEWGNYMAVVLIAVVMLETYQLMSLPFSDWAIKYLAEHHPSWLRLPPFPFLVDRSADKMRWCNKIGQFDLLSFCARKEWPRIYRIAKWLGKGEKLRRYGAATLEDIVPEFKEVLHEKMGELEAKRRFQPFMKRGEWMVCSHPSYDGIVKDSVETEFDKSIIIWHIATEICYETRRDESSRYRKSSKTMSSYMMYLLVERPYTLSLNTSELTLSDACTLLKGHLNSLDNSVSQAMDDWNSGGSGRQGNQNDMEQDRPMTSVLGKNWHLVKDAGELARALKGRVDTWEVISTFWVEMLCFAAFNCPLSKHARLLRQGGDIITHVWLLLAHKTDKHNAIEFPTKSESSEQSPESTLIDVPIQHDPSRRTRLG